LTTNLRTLGPNEARVVLSLSEQGRTTVRAAEVLELLGVESTARKVIRNLIRKGWFVRLIGGRYLFIPPEYGPERLGENNALAIASAVVDPSYVGWWAAASFHGLTTQKPVAVSVAVLRYMSARVIEGSEIRFITVHSRKFYGHQCCKVYGRDVMISTPAKTAIDCLDRPDLAGGASEVVRILHAALRELDLEQIIDIAVQMESTALLQRLGFVADLVATDWSKELRAHLRSMIAKSARSNFGRAERKTGDVGYIADWRLFVNARRQDLLADVPRPTSARLNP
jgi:predicted transcriptional regulator of viral defense system